MPETAPACSHCHAKDAVVEGFDVYHCSSCGWWGTKPDALIYDYESYGDYRESGQVPRRPTS